MHKFLVFCVPAADVSRKDTPDTPYSEQEGKEIQDIPAGKGKDNIQNQNKNQHKKAERICTIAPVH